MARCKCCGKICRTPAAFNWREWQECYPCARENHPEHYQGKRKHGVGGTYLKDGTTPATSMIEQTISISTTH